MTSSVRMTLSLLLLFALGACGNPESDSERSRSSASAQERRDPQAWVEGGALLLDVRTPGEFGTGHLDGALNIPVQELESRLSEVEPERVVVYCRSGNRSATATRILRANGHEVLDIATMDGWGDPSAIVR